MTRRAACRISDYATDSVAKKLADRARACGIEPAAVEFLPGGIVRFLDAKAFPPAPRDEFEELAAAGKLD